MGSAGDADVNFCLNALRKKGDKAEHFFEFLRKAAAQGKSSPGGKLTPDVVEKAIAIFKSEQVLATSSTPAASSASSTSATQSTGKEARPFIVCSTNKVRLWKTPSMDSTDSSDKSYLQPGEEFMAEGPDANGTDGREWLRLVDGRGYACTTSSKDVQKVVLLPARKRGAVQESPATSASMLMNKALLIKKDWCDQIFDNGKIWEIRGEYCNKRGRFCIAQSKSGTIIGEATLVDCLKVGKLKNGKLQRWSRDHKKHFMARDANMPKHRITDLSIVTYPKVFAWVLADPVRYKTPLPYEHKQGCVKWVTLPPELQGRADSAAAGDEQDDQNTSSSSSSSDSDSESDEGN